MELIILFYDQALYELVGSCLQIILYISKKIFKN